MVAIAWTALGLLAATLAALVAAIFQLNSSLSSRIEALGTNLGGRIDAQTARIDAQTARIDAQTARIDALTERLAEHLTDHRA